VPRVNLMSASVNQVNPQVQSLQHPSRRGLHSRLVKSHWAIDGLGHRATGSGFVRPDPRLPSGAQRFWNHVGLDSSDPSGLQGQRDGGVVTWYQGKVIAFCRYHLAGDAEGLEDTRHLTTRSAGPLAGTWVLPLDESVLLPVVPWVLDPEAEDPEEVK
jgi:hypothetical protein